MFKIKGRIQPRPAVGEYALDLTVEESSPPRPRWIETKWGEAVQVSNIISLRRAGNELYARMIDGGRVLLWEAGPDEITALFDKLKKEV